MKNIETSFLLGQLLTREMLKSKYSNIQNSEFKVFSQWGDDGIIQYLINNINISNKIFIEFGVENYLESNTRFLLMNNNWTGLVFDGSKKNIDFVRSDNIYWKYDLIAEQAFITRENINFLIKKAGFIGEIGLLHIDIDGNDYWVWESIEVIKPDIVIIEYNSVFGIDRAITIPYKANFNRTKEHYSNLYAGSSLLALYDLAKEKGYSFIGTNSSGNNAYFILNEKLNIIKPIEIKHGYTLSKFRESRNKKGNLTFLRGNLRLKEIEGLPVYNTRTNNIEKL